MTRPNKLEAGDRVAYAAKLLKNTGMFTGDMPLRRGTFVAYYAGDRDSGFARVKWDDFEPLAARGAGQYADDEYVEDSRRFGQVVHANNIAKVGSPRFALNDM